ncbi:MAG: DNA/RNA helicase, superfamily II [Parcubacteria group bacterium GW2011_GWE2_42_14]|nr:MAG: DNA/RNA helicase, superfamily II [Parcubacteria group bacterium GW2011_GWE2_42_14]
MTELREYQKAAVENLRQALTRNKHVILQASCGAGKTVISADIASRAIEKGKRVLFLVNRRDLVTQTVEKYEQYGLGDEVGIILAGKEPSLGKPIQCASLQTYGRRLKLDDIEVNRWFHNADLVLYDECLSDDTEILTSSGWSLIRDLNGNEKVAQYNQHTKEVSFVVPDKLISRHFSGELIRFSRSDSLDLVGTPSHEQLYFSDGKPEKEVFLKWPVSGNHKYAVSGYKKGNRRLTCKDRFKIMTAADGHIVHKQATEHQMVQFSFSKHRKIVRFQEIMRECGYAYEESKPACKRGNINKRYRFLVRAPIGITKNLRDICSLDNASAEFSREFIKELVQWDGSIKTVMYWSGTNGEDADYIQALCAIGGMRASHNIQIDGRKETYKPIHRMIFLESDMRTCQRIKKECVQYNGNVYCVRVPDGNIVVRRNNKIVITGNCHSSNAPTFRKILENYKEKYIVGLSATPMGAGGTGLGEVFDEIITCVPMAELIEDGFLVPAIHFAPSKPDLQGIGMIGNDYNLKQLDKRIDKPKLAGNILENWLRLASDRKTLIFALNIKHSKYLAETFSANGIRIAHIDAHTNDDDRKEIYYQFEHGDLQIITNVGVACEGSDLPIASCVCVARSTALLSRWLQMAGRGARPYPGKKDYLLLDFAGCIDQHGFVDSPVEWQLDANKPAAVKKVDRTKKEKKIITCEFCKAAFTGKRCPVCGHEFVSHGKKVEFTEADLVIVKGELQKAIAEEKRTFLNMLEYERRKLGKNNKWLLAQYHSKFNEWPKSTEDLQPIEPSEKVKNFLTFQRIRYAKSKRKRKMEVA